MRIDIENSPGAQAGPYWPAARDGLGQRLFSDGAICGNCLCCMAVRDPCRERRAAKLTVEHGNGVLWHHAASTLNAAKPNGRGVRPSKAGTAMPVSIHTAAPQPMLGQKTPIAQLGAESGEP